MDNIVNNRISNKYVTGCIELQILDKLYKSKIIEENAFNIIKSRILQEYNILC